MRTRIVAGRGFADADGQGQPRVAIINEALARSGLLGANPIGQQVYFFGPAPWEIVGIVEDVRQVSLEQEPHPQVFFDFRQRPAAEGPYFVVRTGGEADSAVTSSLLGIVRQIEPSATLDNVASMEELVTTSMYRRRLYAALSGLLAALAVGLAAVGIYGVMAYSVAQRTRELGIRMALGAQKLAVLRLVLGQSLTLTGAGIILGLAGAAAVTRYLEGMLFGLTPLDPYTYLSVAVLFVLVAGIAAYVPARRATKVDPMVALRCE
jgi:putative ABC transport system permease protein